MLLQKPGTFRNLFFIEWKKISIVKTIIEKKFFWKLYLS